MASLTIMFYYGLRSHCKHWCSPDPSLSSSPERPRSSPTHATVTLRRSACSGFQQKLTCGCGVITAPCMSDSRLRESLEEVVGFFTFPKQENPRREMSEMDKAVWKTHNTFVSFVPKGACRYQTGSRRVRTNVLRLCFGAQIGQLLVKMEF